MTPRRPPLRYHGSKWLLGPWIISNFPPHQIYCESFGGGASVLLRKPRVWSEVYNDIDGEVVNFFQVLRDNGEQLLEQLRLTPFARAEFELSYEPTLDPVELARRTVVRSFMGRSSAATHRSHKTGFRAKSGGNTPPEQDWVNLPGALDAVVKRLQGVVIEHRDAIEVMRRHDGPHTLHYVDPPYPLSTRHTGGVGCYAQELTDDDHRQLAAAVRDLEGPAIVSGYPCELYDEELFPEWERLTKTAVASGANGGVERTEVLWLSPACVAASRQMKLFGVGGD
jgi:DNA adenine methylase